MNVKEKKRRPVTSVGVSEGIVPLKLEMEGIFDELFLLDRVNEDSNLLFENPSVSDLRKNLFKKTENLKSTDSNILTRCKSASRLVANSCKRPLSSVPPTKFPKIVDNSSTQDTRWGSSANVFQENRNGRPQTSVNYYNGAKKSLERPSSESKNLQRSYSLNPDEFNKMKDPLTPISGHDGCCSSKIKISLFPRNSIQSTSPLAPIRSISPIQFRDSNISTVLRSMSLPKLPESHSDLETCFSVTSYEVSVKQNVHEEPLVQKFPSLKPDIQAPNLELLQKYCTVSSSSKVNNHSSPSSIFKSPLLEPKNISKSQSVAKLNASFSQLDITTSLLSSTELVDSNMITNKKLNSDRDVGVESSPAPNIMHSNQVAVSSDIGITSETAGAFLDSLISPISAANSCYSPAKSQLKTRVFSNDAYTSIKDKTASFIRINESPSLSASNLNYFSSCNLKLNQVETSSRSPTKSTFNEVSHRFSLDEQVGIQNSRDYLNSLSENSPDSLIYSDTEFEESYSNLNQILPENNAVKNKIPRSSENKVISSSAKATEHSNNESNLLIYPNSLITPVKEKVYKSTEKVTKKPSNDIETPKLDSMVYKSAEKVTKKPSNDIETPKLDSMVLESTKDCGVVLLSKIMSVTPSMKQEILKSPAAVGKRGSFVFLESGFNVTEYSKSLLSPVESKQLEVSRSLDEKEKIKDMMQPPKCDLKCDLKLNQSEVAVTIKPPSSFITQVSSSIAPHKFREVEPIEHKANSPLIIDEFFKLSSPVRKIEEPEKCSSIVKAESFEKESDKTVDVFEVPYESDSETEINQKLEDYDYDSYIKTLSTSKKIQIIKKKTQTITKDMSEELQKFFELWKNGFVMPELLHSMPYLEKFFDKLFKDPLQRMSFEEFLIWHKNQEFSKTSIVGLSRWIEGLEKSDVNPEEILSRQLALEAIRTNQPQKGISPKKKSILSPKTIKRERVIHLDHFVPRSVEILNDQNVPRKSETIEGSADIPSEQHNRDFYLAAPKTVATLIVESEPLAPLKSPQNLKRHSIFSSSPKFTRSPSSVSFSGKSPTHMSTNFSPGRTLTRSNSLLAFSRKSLTESSSLPNLSNVVNLDKNEKVAKDVLKQALARREFFRDGKINDSDNEDHVEIFSKYSTGSTM